MIFKNRYPNIKDLYKLKEQIFSVVLLDKLTNLFVLLKITPNQITVLSLMFGILSLITIVNNQKLFIVSYIINRFLDGLDGYYARKYNLTSKFGSHLDHFGDYIIHVLLLLKVGIELNLSFAFITAIAYSLEFLFLEIRKLTQFKFPTSIFACFFIFGMFELGLFVQLSYQLLSIIYFKLTYKQKSHE